MRISTSRPLAAAAGIAAGAISGVSAETLGPVTDPLGVVKIPKGAPIHIGGYWTLSGPDVDIGLDQKRGAEIAMDDLPAQVGIEAARRAQGVGLDTGELVLHLPAQHGEIVVGEDVEPGHDIDQFP